MQRSVSCVIGQASREADAVRFTNRRQPISMGRQLSQEVGETATCPLMLKATLEPRDSPVQHKKKYANQHWPAEHLNKQPSVIFKVTTVITPTIAIDNQASWVVLPECPCSPGHRTDKPDTPPVLAGCWSHDHTPHGGQQLHRQVQGSQCFDLIHF